MAAEPFMNVHNCNDVTIPESETDFGLFIFGACLMTELVMYEYKDSKAM